MKRKLSLSLSPPQSPKLDRPSGRSPEDFLVFLRQRFINLLMDLLASYISFPKTLTPAILYVFDVLLAPTNYRANTRLWLGFLQHPRRDDFSQQDHYYRRICTNFLQPLTAFYPFWVSGTLFDEIWTLIAKELAKGSLFYFVYFVIKISIPLYLFDVLDFDIAKEDTEFCRLAILRLLTSLKYSACDDESLLPSGLTIVDIDFFLQFHSLLDSPSEFRISLCLLTDQRPITYFYPCFTKFHLTPEGTWCFSKICTHSTTIRKYRLNRELVSWSLETFSFRLTSAEAIELASRRRLTLQ